MANLKRKSSKNNTSIFIPARRAMLRNVAAVSALGIASGVASPLLTACHGSTHQPAALHNPMLKTIIAELHNGTPWLGTPLDADGKFRNVEYPFEPKIGDLLRWQLSENPQKHEKINDAWRLKRNTDISFLANNSDCLVWLGHACFFIRLGGVSMLIDPVFGDIPFTKRYSAFPFDPLLLKNIDYLLISHDHRDHCDKESIQRVVAQNPTVTILAGLGMNDLFEDWLPAGAWKAQYAGWYQQFDTPPSKPELFFLPSRHWSRRGAFDTNSRLWGAFVLRYKSATIYFSGDTGFGSHFIEAGNLFQPTIALIGAGAYSPRWFMKANHIDPQHAVEAFHALQAKTLIPMHYGTFDLSDEPVSEPARLLMQMAQQEKIKGDLCLPNLAEPLKIV